MYIGVFVDVRQQAELGQIEGEEYLKAKQSKRCPSAFNPVATIPEMASIQRTDKYAVRGALAKKIR